MSVNDKIVDRIVAGVELCALHVEATASHPNSMKFKGVLVRLDEASSKPPNGAEGHKIMVTSEVAKKLLPTLINMGLNYDPDLSNHNQRRKVGVITNAWIKGKDLCVEGVVWKHDFPEAEKDLKQPDLGMSMEIGQVHVEDTNAQVWKLTDFHFLGATILFKDAAAYYRTQAIAAKADTQRRNTMAKVNTKKAATEEVVDPAVAREKKIASIAAKAAREAVDEALVDIRAESEETTSILAQIAARLETMSAGTVEVEEVDAKKKKSDDDMEDEECASKKKDENDEDEDDMDSSVDVDSEVDKGDLDEIGEEGDTETNTKIGHLNESYGKNHGDKTTSSTKVGKTVAHTVASAKVEVLQKTVNDLTKKVNALADENKQLKTRVKKVNAQVEIAASAAERKSTALPRDLAGLLAKSNIDVDVINASGQKLSVQQFDVLLASAGVALDNIARMTLKNKAVELGIMEQGVVDRGLLPQGIR